MIASVITLLFIFAPSMFSQDQAATARANAGCGPSQTEFDVKTDKNQHPQGTQQPGKALVYVFETEKHENLTFKVGAVTTRVGLDGAWVGANHGDSYFFFSVDAGDHRLCTDWQSSFKRLSKLGAATSFTAEAGKIYYFRAEIEERQDHPPAVKLETIDSAQGQLLVSSFSFSTSHPKEVTKADADDQ